MHETKRTYCPGLEFYRSSGSNIVGIVNDKEGTQGSYMHLSDEEVLAWTAAWLKGEKWNRRFTMQPELLESA